MSLQVRCPSCEQTLTVEDNQAGKTATCPKCGALMQLPGTPTAPAKKPPVIIPVSEDQPTKSKTRSRRDDEEDEEDDRPRKKSKKRTKELETVDTGSSGKLLVGLLLGFGTLILLCGGGCFGFFYYTMKKADEVVNNSLDDVQKKIESRNVNEANASRISAGMTAGEVEGMFSYGTIAFDSNLAEMLEWVNSGKERADIHKRWGIAIKKGRVRHWRTATNSMLVAFDKTGLIGSTGRVEGVLLLTREYDGGPKVIEKVKLPETKLPPEETEFDEETLSSIKAGMTLAEVEAIFGKSQLATNFTIINVKIGLEADDEIAMQEALNDRWTPMINKLQVVSFSRGFRGLAVAFDGPPKSTGKVIGVIASYDDPSKKTRGRCKEFIVLPAIKPK